MKILFVTDRVNSVSDPNINLINGMLPYLEENNEIFFMGHDVASEKENEFCFIFDRDEKVRKLFFSLNGLSAFGKIIRLLSHPILSFWGLFKVFNIDLVDRKYALAIEKLDKKYNFDAIISVSAPFYTTKGMVKRKTDAKKIIMMFDPYAYHYQFGNNRTKKIEGKCFSKADKVLVPKLLKRHYPDNKVEAFEFPAVITESPEITEPLYNENKVNLAFVGSLYSDIRSPEYMYKLLEALDDEKYHLTIIGGIYGQFSKEFYNRFEPVIEKNVTVVGRVDKETALQYLWQADVLVNIGNKIDNMLPSKVMEYISTGKPVLNIMQITNCPSEEYFERYGNALNLHTDTEITNETTDLVRKFLNTASVVPKDFIENEFRNATPEYVANQILNRIVE